MRPVCLTPCHYARRTPCRALTFTLAKYGWLRRPARYLHGRKVREVTGQLTELPTGHE